MDDENDVERSWKNITYCLALHVLLSLTRGSITYSGLYPSTAIIKFENAPTGLPKDIFLTEIFTFQMTVASFKLILKAHSIFDSLIL